MGALSLGTSGLLGISHITHRSQHLSPLSFHQSLETKWPLSSKSDMEHICMELIIFLLK